MSEISEEEKARRAKENETKISMSIDIEQVNQLMEEKKKLQDQLDLALTEKEDYKCKLELVAEKAFQKKKAEVGCIDPNVVDGDSLLEWERNKNLHARPSGNIPLSPQQIGEKNSEGFDTYEEMVDFLRDTENSKTASPKEREEAKVVLNKLFENWANNVKRNPEEGKIGTKEFLEPYKESVLRIWKRRKGYEVEGE